MFRFFAILAVMWLYCCQAPDNKQFEPQTQRLLADAQRLNCRLQNLGEASTDLWDSVTVSLRQVLPPNMPPEERHNMLAVRSAGLIRMFKVYPSLDSSIHGLVDQAEQSDQALAEQLRATRDSLKTLNNEVQAMLALIERNHPEDYADWRSRFDTLHCPTHR